LAKERKITLELTDEFNERIMKSARNSVLCVQVSDSETSRIRTVCFDMFDGFQISSVERLKLCDVYFKRSFSDEYVGGLDGADRKKIVPYGLNYECRSRNERDVLRRLFISRRATPSLSGNLPRSLKYVSIEVLKHLLLKADIDVLGLKPMAIADFVVEPSEPAESKVLLQTRLWTPEECPRIGVRQLQEINDMRVDTVRSLRKRLGGRFVGGLVPTAFARQHHRDLCLEAKDTGRRTYMDAVKNCLVCVTTTGLHDSIGFRLPEYLAASRCVVTEPLRCRLPVQLKEGSNYLTFRTPDECVEACERLLADPQSANRMRHENYRYYRNEVEPSALVQKCLTTAISHSS
jgi:hypothetical protein